MEIVRFRSHRSQCSRSILAGRYRQCSLALIAALVLGLSACGNSSPKACILPPSISSLSPNVTQAGGPEFTLKVTGDTFYYASFLRWNGASLPTTIVSQTQLSAVIPASDIAEAGTAKIKVTTPFVPQHPNVDCEGDSNTLDFTINP